MEVTNVDNQTIVVKNKIEDFFKRSMKYRKITGMCLVKDAMAVLTDKWSLFVLYNLGYFDTLRFSDLNNNIRGISSRMLSVTLKKLELHKLIKRQAFAEVPPRVEYSLTSKGLDMVERAIGFNLWLLDEKLKEVGNSE